MQLKRYEAPTLQEALDAIKRELGPEAVILQTKRNKKSFGLMSQASVEVTVAVSEKSTERRASAESRLTPPAREAFKQMSATRQADAIDSILSRAAQAKTTAATSSRTRTSAPSLGRREARYVDILEDGSLRAPTPSRVEMAPPLPPPAASLEPAIPAVQHLEQEVAQLKRLLEQRLESVASAQSSAQSVASEPELLGSPALAEAFEAMVIQGVERRLALRVLKQAMFELSPEEQKQPERVIECAAAEMMASTPVLSVMQRITQACASRTPGSPPQVLAVVGPTGVGKTTTVAKLASLALLRHGLKVGLINLDCYKVAAFDQLATYAKILNTPFRSASNAEDLKSALAELSSLDLILIDTTGRSQRDPGALHEARELLARVPELRTELVLSMTTREQELYDMAQRFSVFRPEGLILSKLDEGTCFGPLYNAAQRCRLPLAFFTTGQRVPEDLEEATAERVVSLVFELQ